MVGPQTVNTTSSSWAEFEFFTSSPDCLTSDNASCDVNMTSVDVDSTDSYTVWQVGLRRRKPFGLE